MTKNKGKLIVLSGFSGSGKGTVIKSLMQKYNDYALSISATTRAPRPGDEDGVTYFFKTREEFEQLISDNALIEYAEYVGNYYGTPRAYVEEKLAQGFNVILEIETKGAMNIRAQYPEALLIFITPPSFDELYKRLTDRQTESEEKVRGRMKTAAQEVYLVKEYDHLLINYGGRLEECMEELNSIVRQELKKDAFIADLETEAEPYR